MTQARGSSRRGRGPLTPQDWARAALEAIAGGGIAAVAVERLAAGLGATKGSFYHHFRNRDALVAAALDLWEREHTDALIDAMRAESGAEQRVRRLFTLISDAHAENRIEVALLATAEDPRVAPVLDRVTERRVAHVAMEFRHLGWRPTAARRQALLAYSAWLGFVQLVHAAPSTIPAKRARRAYVRHALDVLLAPPPEG